jgi:hypothetical protein
VLLTDIHDGRKKVFLRSRGPSRLRLAVVDGDALGAFVLCIIIILVSSNII